MWNEDVINIILALGLSLFHLLSGKLKFISKIPRSIWLSVAGGVSTAYVFLHLIPELAAGDKLFKGNYVYLLALGGLVTFYGLDKFAIEKRKAGQTKGREGGAFLVYITSYLIYNFIIGYVLVAEFSGAELYFFTLAMAFHFLVNDYSLRHHHRQLYHDKGRWLISLGIAAGAVVALVTTISHHIIAGGTAFVGGAVIMNALKEELPEEHENKFWAFLAGTAGYAAILVFWDNYKG